MAALCVASVIVIAPSAAIFLAGLHYIITERLRC